MPLDPRVRRFLDALASGKTSDPRAHTPDERRAALAALMQLSGPVPSVATVSDHLVPGPAGAVPVRLYVPNAVGPAMGPGLVYLHGGGLVAGSVTTHDAIARALATAGGCRVVSVDYRRAPEHRFPAGLEDAIAALRHVAGHPSAFGLDPERLGVCGDSAGGTLAAAACHSFVSGTGPRLALQLLLCPILDYAGRSASRVDFGRGYLVDEATLDHDLACLLPPGIDATDPRVSPLRAADLAGLPPTVVHTAEFDPLRDEGRAYYDRLIPTGAAVSYTCHAGMIHLFYGLGGVIPYAQVAFELIGRDIRAALN